MSWVLLGLGLVLVIEGLALAAFGIAMSVAIILALFIFGTLEARLQKHPWLAGDEYSLADIMHFSWLRIAHYAGIDLARFPALSAWVATINARPAVQRALARFQN